MYCEAVCQHKKNPIQKLINKINKQNNNNNNNNNNHNNNKKQTKKASYKKAEILRGIYKFNGVK